MSVNCFKMSGAIKTKDNPKILATQVDEKENKT
jgi:hypothetical protein